MSTMVQPSVTPDGVVGLGGHVPESTGAHRCHVNGSFTLGDARSFS